MVTQIAPSTPVIPQARIYSADELAVLSAQSDVKEILRITEMYTGKPLKSSDIQTLMFWYDELHMSADLIEYLVEYCISKNHSSFHYMNKVAINWAEAGITSVSQAKGENELRSENTRAIMKAFGISGRNLTDGELDYVKRWENEYHFTLPIIQEAQKRTILTIQKPSFDYADSILSRWHKAGVATLDDITKLDQAFDATKRQKSAPTRNTTTASNNRSNRFRNFDERDYDYDALEAKLLQKRR
jgi:DnaD/phage-associated family protein